MDQHDRSYKFANSEQSVSERQSGEKVSDKYTTGVTFCKIYV